MPQSVLAEGNAHSVGSDARRKGVVVLDANVSDSAGVALRHEQLIVHAVFKLQHLRTLQISRLHASLDNRTDQC